ncbi:MAG: aldehyde dehydrogenase [Nanoarchaeota archaeon]|nr:aldehyde dehydrogenase [Nanoarchaeota archaeon]
MVLRVCISGLGRIGKGVLRVNSAQTDENRKFEVVAIKDVVPLENLAYLLKHDSLYGLFDKEVGVEGDNLVIDGKKIPYFQTPHAKDVPWDKLNVDYLIEASGKVPHNELRGLLEKKIVKKVICTWNVPDADITLIQGINNSAYIPDKHNLISVSTCTGNGLVPIMYLLEKHFGVSYGHIVTIHPVLSDQKLVDVPHQLFHLGRMATRSIIPTSTNVVKSTILLIPSLKGKLDCISYRVPTSIVSVIDLNVTLGREVTKEGLTSLFEGYSKKELKGIINCDYGFMKHRKVSIDFVRSIYSSILLMQEMQITNGKNLSLSIMHDNEWAYCNRVLDVINFIKSYDKEITSRYCLALDFDGVIVNSVEECLLVGYNAFAEYNKKAKKIQSLDDLGDQTLKKLKKMRNFIKFGEDYVYLNLALAEGMNIRSQEAFNSFKKKHIDLQSVFFNLFYDERESFSTTHKEEWLKLNSFYNGMKEFLLNYKNKKNLFIISTKRKEFILKILKANSININEQNIFHANEKKTDIISEILIKRKIAPSDFYFVDDQVTTLLDVKAIEVNCFLADWGYNSYEQYEFALDHNIKSIEIDDFLEQFLI